MIKRILSVFICAVLLIGTLSSCSGNADDVNLYDSTESAQFGAYKHYFSALSEVEKAAYNCVLREIENFPEKIQVPTMYTEQLERVWLALMYDNPELFMLGKECGLSITKDGSFFYCDYSLGKAEYEEKKQLLEDKVKQIENELSKRSNVFDKELYIHNLIIDSCNYVSTDDLMESTACGVLIDGEASCEGYAKAAKLLLDVAGIESYLVCGTATRDDGAREGHMWNIVSIDSKQYNLDVTWDDPISEDSSENKRYSYFNITDTEIQKTHSFEKGPAGCTATDENYFVRTESLFDEYNADMRDELSKLIAKAGEERKIHIRFSKKEAYESALEGLFDKEEIYRVLDVAAVSSTSKFSTRQIKYVNDDTHLILELILVS